MSELIECPMCGQRILWLKLDSDRPAACTRCGHSMVVPTKDAYAVEADYSVVAEDLPDTATTNDAPSPRSLARNSWPWLFIAASFTWAFWGSWRVVDLAVSNIQPIANLAKLVRDLPHAPWPIRIVVGVVLLVLMIFWMCLPSLLLMFVVSMMDKRQGERVSQRAWGGLKEVIGFVVGAACLFLVWLGLALFLAFFGDLLDLIGAVIMLGFIVFFFASHIWRSISQQKKD